MNYTNAVQNYLKFAALHTLLKKRDQNRFSKFYTCSQIKHMILTLKKHAQLLVRSEP